MRRSIQPLLIAASIAAFACAPEAQATITSCNETAIRDAVASHAAIFGVNCSITLTQGPLQIPPGNGSGAGAPATSINGNGFAVTLSGGNTHGVIVVPPGATLNLSGVTIANGRTASSMGGGISNGGSLQVTNCTFTGNTNAILNTGTLSVTSSTFTGNPAPSGGAIILQAAPTRAYLANNAFAGNGGGEQGGAIYTNGASAEINNSSFTGNIATQGGAIYANLSTLTLSNIYFQGNKTNPGGFGGAIANLGSNITITDPFASIFGFQSNAAVSATAPGLGGAIYNAGVETVSCGLFCFEIFHAPSLALNTVYFSGNTAANGGAIYSLGNTGTFGNLTGATSVTNSYFFGNSATGLSALFGPGSGGAIDNEGSAQLSVAASTFHANIAPPPNSVISYLGVADINSGAGLLKVANSTFFGSGNTVAIQNSLSSSGNADSGVYHSGGQLSCRTEWTPCRREHHYHYREDHYHQPSYQPS